MKRIDTSRENWVGFASSPKARAGAKPERMAAELMAPGAISQHLNRFITAAGLSSWLAIPSKFDARLGAKLKFSLLPADIEQEDDDSAFGGTFTSLVIPKQIVLTTERHGEILISLRESKGNTEVSIRFNSSLLPDEMATWQRLATAAMQRLSMNLESTDSAKASS